MPRNPCEHLNFAAHVAVGRIQCKTGMNYSAEVKIHCTECKEEFMFVGLEHGMDPMKPMVSVDGTEARMPIVPSSDPKTVHFMPSYRIRKEV